MSTVRTQGQVLNETSAWWMGVTHDMVPNALLAVPDPNVAVMRKCTVFPVEVIVRGFMTGACPRWYPALPALPCADAVPSLRRCLEQSYQVERGPFGSGC